MPRLTDDQIEIYWSLFVNRSDYSRQAAIANASGKHAYFRARKRVGCAPNQVTFEPLALTKRQVREHLLGYITLGLYNLRSTKLDRRRGFRLA